MKQYRVLVSILLASSSLFSIAEQLTNLKKDLNRLATFLTAEKVAPEKRKEFVRLDREAEDLKSVKETLTDAPTVPGAQAPTQKLDEVVKDIEKDKKEIPKASDISVDAPKPPSAPSAPKRKQKEAALQKRQKDMQTLEDQIKASPIFGGLSPEEKAAIDERITRVQRAVEKDLKDHLAAGICGRRVDYDDEDDDLCSDDDDFFGPVPTAGYTSKELSVFSDDKAGVLKALEDYDTKSPGKVTGRAYEKKELLESLQQFLAKNAKEIKKLWQQIAEYYPEIFNKDGNSFTPQRRYTARVPMYWSRFIAETRDIGSALKKEMRK